MLKADNDSYDVVIIGAGLSGLVCGCYLAKAGMKVLIAEQHFKPGGYCTSFKRRNFTFDAAAHSFGGYRKDGIVRKVFHDLEVDKRLSITRYDPSDIIITPEHKISFWANLDKTISELQKAFPDERDKIRDFFYFLTNPEPGFLAQTRSWTFKNLLDQYFKSYKLKTILSFPLFGNGGLPPSLMSSFIGVKIFREFLLDGGYYPKAGMQTIPNAIAERFKEYGGDLRLSCLVKKIRVSDCKVTGVDLEKDGFIRSKYVVSNCDARQTFLNLLNNNSVSDNLLNKIDKMTPSPSMFILYLGVNKNFDKLPRPGINHWFLSQYNLDAAYLSVQKGDVSDLGRYMVHVLPDNKSVLAFLNVSFNNKKYWDDNKKLFSESFINVIENNTIPGLSNNLDHCEAATPHTLYRYTLNYKGAAYGWASIPSQLADSDFKKPSFIQGLYLTGHWSTQGLGISGVIYLGFDTANLIIRKNRKKSDIIIC
jgi:phytoene dehydrogenase-like protein